MKNYTDNQNHVLISLAYANIDNSKTWKPGARVVDLVEEPYKSQLKEAGLDHLVIVDYVNNNDSGSHSGFCAIAFMDPNTGERGMSFRGTENLDKIKQGENQVDMADNIHTALSGESVQKQEAIKFYERNKADGEYNYVYGHSKGGELASEVYVEYYDEIQQMHVLNPQPINPTQLNKDQQEALKSDEVDVVIIDGDTVHSLGDWPYSEEDVRIIQNNGSQDGFFGPHLKESAKIDGDNYVIENDPFAKYPEQEIFCKTVRPIITAAQEGGMPKSYIFVYSLASIYTFFVRDLPAAVDAFKEAAARVMEALVNTKEKIEDIVNGFKEFMQTAINKIKDWYNRNLNTGYKYASANPQISVDTRKLRNYAQRLQSVNTRISELDRSLDTLYWKVGLLDLWNLIQADMLTGYSWRINRCVSYLNETATDFDNVESTLLNNL